MTTETDRARPRNLGRIDPALRDTAARLDIAEFRTESLPAERESADRLAADRAAAVDSSGVEIDDVAIAGPGGQQLGLRLYRGLSTSAAPLVLYAHGGGFVTGNLDTDHRECVQLAREADCLVVSVDYRLAPEHPCPAALDDVEAALRYVVDNSASLNADGSRVVVMGRDAGAALVAALAQRMFDHEGPKILAQVLHQPMLDPDATPSRREFQRSPGLNGPAISRAWAHYLGHGGATAEHVPAHRANLEGPAAGVHQLRRDRPVPRRSHRLCEPTAACLRAHGVTCRRGHLPRVRLGCAVLGGLAGKRCAACADVAPVFRGVTGPATS